MPSAPTLHTLLIDEIKDLFHTELELLKALPKMAKAATNPGLKARFIAHLAQTRGHVTRLVRSHNILGLPSKREPCHATLGLVEEGAAAIETKGPAALRDVALIGAAQHAEEYEIVGYGTARAFAQALGENQVADLLQETLDEKGEANEEFTQFATTVNDEARAHEGRNPAVPMSEK